MSIRSQLKNFLRALVTAPPTPAGRRGHDALARTARDLKVVNMSIEDDRLACSESNARYVRSLGDG